MGGVTGLTLVVLAAGSGTRFGGRKQLAVVGPDGAAIMDISVRRAATAGFDRAVIVIAPGMEAQVREHLVAVGDPPIPVEVAVQPLVPGRSRPLGTADAVLAARAAVHGSFAVVNGDDVYPERAFAQLAASLSGGSKREHALVAFRVGQTLGGDRAVSRARLDLDDARALVAIHEGTVVPGGDGRIFETAEGSKAIGEDALVSMNMWGFRPSIFEPLAAAVAQFVADDRDGEAWLPSVVQAEIDAGVIVRVLVSEERCFGVTHEADLAAVRSALL
jgi:molybdopterin-guanine dinucleotide biosynthesis protein A